MTALAGTAAGTFSTESTTLSDSEAARLASVEALHAEWARRAVRVIASSAHDGADARLLLSILGLDHDVVVAARTELVEHHPRRTTRKRHAA
jgi:hypothetical protein